MTPIEWRTATKLTLDEAARRAGIGGVNPGRTYQRYECGRRAAPVNVIEAIAHASGGSVGPSEWHQVRARFLGMETRALAEEAA